MRIKRHLAVEQCLAHHLGGKRPGLFHHLDRLARRSDLRPARHLRLDGGHQIGKVDLKHLRVEGSLLWHAELLPQSTIDGDHAAAEDRTQPFQIFGVVIEVRNQHVLGMRGLAQ